MQCAKDVLQNLIYLTFTVIHYWFDYKAKLCSLRLESTVTLLKFAIQPSRTFFLVNHSKMGLQKQKTKVSQKYHEKSEKLHYHIGKQMDSCLSPRALAWSETQTAASIIWTRLSDFISSDGSFRFPSVVVEYNENCVLELWLGNQCRRRKNLDPNKL